ncbi:MAG: class I SAM-dependent methyltransferase [Anaerolineae bacterium]|nr:class I SAM-dependent methyltransferase [Anaerolineae bacterium]
MPPSELAALRGEPSYVWRAGQERRLQMIAQWTNLDGARVLEAGGGLGVYAAQIGQRYAASLEMFDIEIERVREGREQTPHAVVSAAEHLPYPCNYFDTVLSSDVIEHVADDQMSAAEMVRVLKPGGRAVIFTPNRWYPFETHGHYWRGEYHFGNTPLINYLPDNLRNRLAPHVRTYTSRGLRRLFDSQPVRIVTHHRIFAGYDNIIARLGRPAQQVRDVLYRLEGTPLDVWAYSHMLVVEKLV